MGLKYLVLALCFCFALSQTQEKLKISLYYEAHCKDSIDFIIEQLYPVYTELYSYLVVDFVPFGKASYEFANGTYTFDCQHGESECHANKIHSLFLKQHYPDHKKMYFVHCMMTSEFKQTLRTAKYCSEKVRVSSGWINSFNTMAEELLANNGERTHSEVGPLSFVPTIVFNEEYDTSVHWAAFKDLKKTVCRLLKNVPQQCNSPLPNKYYRL